MSQTQAALEHLRVIRSLMEKAHIYRAVSAPAALLGGVLALGATIWPVVHAAQTHGDAAFSNTTFLLVWHGILAACTVLNVALLAREAARRGQSLVSDGMKMALRAVSPPLIVGGVLAGGLVIWLQNLTLAALTWVLCYGLALLATASFSPKSLTRLGWAFVIAGLVLFLVWAANGEVRDLRTDLGPASLVMALTFGLLHVVYAIAVFVSRPRGEEEAAA
ncbi:MAG: hypothetical protein JNG86_17340 [Verrucomicrobiaceae bacterium]|nr:hypothetical protein [Verrucomicrobiaceae bacterium]